MAPEVFIPDIWAQWKMMQGPVLMDPRSLIMIHPEKSLLAQAVDLCFDIGVDPLELYFMGKEHG